MQFEIGMSTSRYLPARGTAGFARSLVSGNRRVPWPPPMMTERTLLVLTDCRPVCDIDFNSSVEKAEGKLYARHKPGKRQFFNCSGRLEAAPAKFLARSGADAYNAAHVELSHRNHRRQWALSHRRFHQPEMGQRENAVRRAVGCLPHRPAGGARGGLSP